MVGIHNLTVKINTGDQIIIDGIEGHVIANPSDKILEYYIDNLEKYKINYECKTNILLPECINTPEQIYTCIKLALYQKC